MDGRLQLVTKLLSIKALCPLGILTRWSVGVHRVGVENDKTRGIAASGGRIRGERVNAS